MCGLRRSPLPPALRDRAAAESRDRSPATGAGCLEYARTADAVCSATDARAGRGWAAGRRDGCAGRRGLPINLATAMQLAGVRPLDIEAATVQVRQALALQLQARALLIPTLNAGVDYFRHDGVQQNIFTGPEFPEGPTDLLRRRRAEPVCRAHRCDLQSAGGTPRGRRAAGRRSDRAERRLVHRLPGVLRASVGAGRLLGVGASIARAELLVNFTTALAPSLIAPLEINRAKAELESLRQTQQVAIRDWQSRERSAGGDLVARTGDAARAGGTAVSSGHAGLLRPIGQRAGAGRGQQSA